MQTILYWISDLLWPARCLCCDTIGTPLCRPCADGIPLRRMQSCPTCARPHRLGVPCSACESTSMIDRLIAATDLRGSIIDQAVWHLKYRNSSELADALGDILVRATAASIGASDFFNNPLVIPVPLHPARLRVRGYNQAELLAIRLARAAAFPLITDVLVRSRNTTSQVETTSRAQRRDNMRGAFTVAQPEKVTDRDIILVDDVCTTGATLNAAALALKEAGVAHILAITLAHG